MIDDYEKEVNMKKWYDMKKVILIIAIVIYLMTGCVGGSDEKYIGENTELYSVAIKIIRILGGKG